MCGGGLCGDGEGEGGAKFGLAEGGYGSGDVCQGIFRGRKGRGGATDGFEQYQRILGEASCFIGGVSVSVGTNVGGGYHAGLSVVSWINGKDCYAVEGSAGSCLLQTR